MYRGETVKSLWFYTRIEQLNEHPTTASSGKEEIFHLEMEEKGNSGSHSDTDSYVKKYLQLFVNACLAVEWIYKRQMYPLPTHWFPTLFPHKGTNTFAKTAYLRSLKYVCDIYWKSEWKMAVLIP